MARVKSIKFESRQKLLPVLKIVTHTAYASWPLLGSASGQSAIRPSQVTVNP